MRIGIFWLGTSVYKNYFDNFISTFRNLFPNDEKTLVVLSDGFEELDGKQYEFADCCYYPREYFCPKWENDKFLVTENTYTIHHFTGLW